MFFLLPGLFSSSGMTYDILRKTKNRTFEPTLTEMVEKALEILKKNPKGFFLLVEGNTWNQSYRIKTSSWFFFFNELIFNVNILSGGEIDWAHHEGKAKISLSEATAFAEAVKRGRELTNKGQYE